MNSAVVHPTREETLRAREVYRYYQPRGSTESLATSESSSQEATNFAASKVLLHTALTAFTQLIALRFDAQRAILSLSDCEFEYFLAESTSSLSPLSPDCYAQNYFLSSDDSKVPRGASLCEQTLELALDPMVNAFPVCVVPDLRMDRKLGQLRCVKGEPYLRFYCGAALVNNTGFAIGSIYVVDSTTRGAVSLEEIEFLKMMAGTVMEYLETIRAKEEVSRVTRMSQGLHAFIEGAGTMYGNWRRLRRQDLPQGAGIAYSWKSDRLDVPEPHRKGRSESESPGKVTPLSDSSRSADHGERGFLAI
jgi:hypothetical protein